MQLKKKPKTKKKFKKKNSQFTKKIPSNNFQIKLNKKNQ